MSEHLKKWRKRPVEVAAMQLPSADRDATPEFVEALHAFLGPASWESGRDGALIIHTLEGDHLALPGDYIIRGVKGEFYPCKPDIFAASYEPADVASSVPGPSEEAVRAARNAYADNWHALRGHAVALVAALEAAYRMDGPSRPSAESTDERERELRILRAESYDFKRAYMGAKLAAIRLREMLYNSERHEDAAAFRFPWELGDVKSSVESDSLAARSSGIPPSSPAPRLSAETLARHYPTLVGDCSCGFTGAPRLVDGFDQRPVAERIAAWAAHVVAVLAEEEGETCQT